MNPFSPYRGPTGMQRCYQRALRAIFDIPYVSMSQDPRARVVQGTYKLSVKPNKYIPTIYGTVLHVTIPYELHTADNRCSSYQAKVSERFASMPESKLP